MLLETELTLTQAVVSKTCDPIFWKKYGCPRKKTLLVILAFLDKHILASRVLEKLKKEKYHNFTQDMKGWP